MLAEILPAAVAVAEATDDSTPAALLPGEEAGIVRAVASRRREYATVRHCARRAMAGLGIPPAPLVPGERGAPRWPDGVVGSLTHCAGYRAAAVARAADAATVGIDAEPHAPLPDGVERLIATPAERDRLRRLADTGPAHWDRLLFSAKEAVYKAWFPLTRRWLGFHDVSLVVHPATGTFTATVLIPAPAALGTITGRWLVRDGLVLTAVALCRS